MKLNEDIQKILEKTGVTLATVNENNRPHLIVVADVKVLSENKILIADNFMKNTIENVQKNNNVCIMAWDKRVEWGSKAFEIIGKAEYFSKGKWKEKASEIDPECDTKGAILVNVSEIKVVE